MSELVFESARGLARKLRRDDLLVVRRPEKVFQVCVRDPLVAGFDFLPNLAQCVFCRSPSSVSEAGIIEHRLEEWLQSIEQRLLTYPIENRRDA